MKTAFNILPDRTQNELLHLLVEAGDHSISFIWFIKTPFSVKGLAIYNFSNNILQETMSGEIENILHSNSIFNKQHASVTICYDNRESLLVPGAYYNNGTVAEDMMNLVFATDADSSVRDEATRIHSIYNVYAVNKKIEAVLSVQFPEATIHHASSLQVEKNTTGDKFLYGIFFHNSIKVILFDGHALQLVQQFSYNTPVDAAYHLLNSCEQYDIKPTEVKLVLSGLIDEKSKLYSEIHRFFLNIQFEQHGDDVELHERIKFYPPHFFSHLTGLALCVS